MSSSCRAGVLARPHDPAAEAGPRELQRQRVQGWARAEPLSERDLGPSSRRTTQDRSGPLCVPPAPSHQAGATGELTGRKATHTQSHLYMPCGQCAPRLSPRPRRDSRSEGRSPSPPGEAALLSPSPSPVPLIPHPPAPPPVPPRPHLLLMAVFTSLAFHQHPSARAASVVQGVAHTCTQAAAKCSPSAA